MIEAQTTFISNKNLTMRKSNLLALKFLFPWLISLGILVFTVSQNGFMYWIGQLLGSLFFIQSFILIHECGHQSFFRNTYLNQILGFMVGFISQIPFTNWQKIHELHHRWTGFRDKDPTTEGTIQGPSAMLGAIVNFCWRFSIPLFALGYRFGIYWNRAKLKKHLNPADYQICLLHLFFHASSYLLLFLIIPKTLLFIFPAWFIGLMVTELVILSQHSYIKMPLALGEKVKPLKTQDQIQYTRSLDFPLWISRWVLLNMNYHEAHHYAPNLPCYFLDQLNIHNKNLTNGKTWYKKAKTLPALEYIFNTQTERDF